jgi:hypothetical protein
MEEVLAFLNHVCNGTRQGTKSSRFAYLRSFFNFIRNNIDHDFQNPCEAPMFKRIFRPAEATHWNIIDKEIVDELPRPLLYPFLELMPSSLTTDTIIDTIES